jgi:hypothetical protein
LEERVVMAAQGVEPQYTAVAVSGATPVYQPAALLPSEVQSLIYSQFNLLDATSIQYLTTAQIASIPDSHWFIQIPSTARAALSQLQVQSLNVSKIQLQYLTPQQVSWLSVTQLRSLPVPEFSYLSAAQTPYLTSAQVSLIPDQHWLNQIPAEARAALTAPQIQALNVAQTRLVPLTPQQRGWLTPGQIASLELLDFAYLTAAQTPYLTTQQIASIPDTHFLNQFTPSARAALSQTQIQALNVANIRLDGLTAQQVAWLSPVQITRLNVVDFKFLTASQTPYLTAQQLASILDTHAYISMSASARAAIPGWMIKNLNVRNIRIEYLTSVQRAWLTASQVASLPINDLGYLGSTKAQFLTTAQLAAIPDSFWFENIQAATRAALNPAQVQALNVANIRLDGLTAQQIVWLSPTQITRLGLADFKFLSAAQTPYLTGQQLAAIPDTHWFSAMSASARAAIPGAQIKYLNVANIRIEYLTSVQRVWLTAAQVASLPITDLGYLGATKAQFITTAQLAAIPDTYWFAKIQPATRAALSIPQLWALNVANIRLDAFSQSQVAWLSSAQVRQVNWIDFHLLQPHQIPLLTSAQLAAVPNGAILEGLPDELQLRFTRAQLVSLPPAIYAFYMSAVAPPTNYTPTVDIPVDGSGVPINHAAHAEHERVMNLVPTSSMTHIAAASGDWTDPAVWLFGNVPAAGARVVIPEGVTVRFNESMTAAEAIKTLRVDGALTFATNVNTQLAADTIVVTDTGSLTIGTASAPIAWNVTAKIYISSATAIDRVWDPYQLSRGLVSMGEVTMFGQATTSFLELAVAPSMGNTQLQFNGIPTNWKVGDRIILTGSDPYSQGNHTEELVIRAISGSTVTVDPLRYDHLPPSGLGLKMYAANLSRNVQFITDAGTVASQRPHLMFLHNPNVSIENISVVGYGRTDKSIPVNDSIVVNGVLQPGTGTNPRARYAMHFHHTGVNPNVAPVVARSNVVVDSAGWGYVNHQSNVVMEYNVSYNVLGAGFVTEDGNEIGVMRSNLALGSIGSKASVNSRGSIHDFGHTGNGFWLQGPGVEVVNNVAAGHAGAGFAYFTSSSKSLFDAVNLDDPSLAAGLKAVPVGTVPLKRFAGNVSMTSRSGLEVWNHQMFMTDGESIIDNFVTWGTRNTGIELHYVGQLTIRNPLIVGELAAYYGVGIFSNHKTHDITIQNPRITGFEQGIVAPPRRANVITGGWISALQGIYVNGANDTVRTLHIDGTQFLPATSAQLGGRQQQSIYLDGRVSFVERRLAAMVAMDHITYVDAAGRGAVLHFLEQGGGQIPFLAGVADGYVPDAYIGRPNWELEQDYGIQLAGRFQPDDYAFLPEIRGFVEYLL